MFTKIILDYKRNLFFELCQITEFEDVTKGRKGAILIKVKNDDLIPIVRTTTKYSKPAQKFKPIHFDIMANIRSKSNLEEIGFNNALIEIYDNQYCTMGFHSDQALDLADNSYIAIYSCYEKPDTNQTSKENFRKLVVKNKKTNELSEIIMEPNSVIIFSTESNKQHLHKIILEDNNKNNNNNRWFGITFRLSKTFIHHINGIPIFHETNNILKIASDEETKDFYKLRSEENKSSKFEYPEITYTISNSDVLSIK